jgi:hypothetical protein
MNTPVTQLKQNKNSTSEKPIITKDSSKFIESKIELTENHLHQITLENRSKEIELKKLILYYSSLQSRIEKYRQLENKKGEF